MLEDSVRDRHVWISAAERTLADLAAFSEPAREDALAAEIARTGQAHMSWVEMQRSDLELMRGHILSQDLDALIGDENWAALKADLIAAKTEYWTTFDRPAQGAAHLAWFREPRSEDGAAGGPSGPLQSQRVGAGIDPSRSASAAGTKAEEFGITRAPHRMGGPRDVMQGYASPADDDLAVPDIFRRCDGMDVGRCGRVVHLPETLRSPSAAVQAHLCLARRPLTSASGAVAPQVRARSARTIFSFSFWSTMSTVRSMSALGAPS